MIPLVAQGIMSKRAGSTLVEVKGSHSIYVSLPQPVASLIEKAARLTREPKRMAFTRSPVRSRPAPPTSSTT